MSLLLSFPLAKNRPESLGHGALDFFFGDHGCTFRVKLSGLGGGTGTGSRRATGSHLTTAPGSSSAMMSIAARQ
jgi:hypothetical protein